jgi:dTDP-glucose 4,6-dehydratase
MRVLITGGAGFIGSHLSDRMLAEGHQVIAMDSLITGSLRNIAHLRDHPAFSFVNFDVTSPIHVDGDLDAVVHLASLPSPVDYLELPIKTLKVGALGTYYALGLPRPRKRVYLGLHIGVFGDRWCILSPELLGNVNPLRPPRRVHESKRCRSAHHGLPPHHGLRPASPAFSILRAGECA